MRRPRLILALTAVLAGCAVGPDYRTPQAPVAADWVGAADPTLKRTEVDLARWWQVFGDPVLNRLVTLTRHQNLSLQAAAIRILEARARLGIASGSLYPQRQRLTGDLSRQTVSQHAPNTSPAMDRHFTTAGIGFDVGWELDVWGKFRRGVEAAEANLAAAAADHDDLLVSLTAETARTYVLVRALQARIRVAEENRAIQRQTLRIAEALYRGGAIDELDLLQARSLLHTTEASIPPLRAALRQGKNALAVLVGRPPGAVDAIVAEPRPIPAPPVTVVIGVPADLLRRRPDVRRAERRLATQSALIGVAEADLYPHFSLLGSLNLRASDAALTFASGGASKLADLFSARSFQYFVGPSLSWDVFNYGRLRNQVRAEDARFQALVATYRQTVLTAAREAEDAIAAFVNARVRQEKLRHSYEAARRSVALSLLQYREGLVGYQRVLDSQRSLLTTQDALTRARGDVAIQLVRLYKALGGGWQGHGRAIPEAVRREMAERTEWGSWLRLEDGTDPDGSW